MFEHEPNILFGVWFNQIFEPEPEWRFRFGVRMNTNIRFRTEHFGGHSCLVIATGMETRPGFCAGYGRVRVRVQIIVPGATRTRIYLDPYPSTRVEYWLTKKKNYTST